YAFLDLNKSAVGDKIRDLTFNSLSGRETLLDLVPRVLLWLLESERNALLFLVDVEHNDFQLLPDFQQFAGMSQSTPGHVRHVQQTIHAVEINKRAEVRDVFHGADYAIAEVHVFQEFLALFAALLFDHLPPAEHDVLSVVIELNDFEVIG